MELYLLYLGADAHVVGKRVERAQPLATHGTCVLPCVHRQVLQQVAMPREPFATDTTAEPIHFGPLWTRMVRQDLPGSVALATVWAHMLPCVLCHVPAKQSVCAKSLAANGAWQLQPVYRSLRTGMALQIFFACKHLIALVAGELASVFTDVTKQIQRLIEALAAQVTRETAWPLGPVESNLFHIPVELFHHCATFLLYLSTFSCICIHRLYDYSLR